MNYNPQELRKAIIKKRCFDKDISISAAAKEIGISKATLSRLENLHTPDINTFHKVYAWLNENSIDKFFK